MVKSDKKWLRTTILLFLSLCILGLSPAWSQERQVVVIGIMVPQEENPLYLTKLKNAYQIAIQETFGRSNEDIRFFLQMIEYPADIAKLKETLEQAIKARRINALVGGFSSSDSQVIAEVAEKNSLPYISIAFPPLVNKSGWVFHLQPPPDNYLAAFEGFATEEVKVKTLAVLYEDTPLGSAFANSIKTMTQKKGWSLLAFGAYPVEAVNFKDFFAQLKNQKPDILVMISFSADAIFALRQAEELNINLKAFVGVGPFFGFQELADPAVKQSSVLFVLSPWVGNSKLKIGVKFAEVYQERYGHAPHSWEALGYSAVRVLADAISRAGSSSPKKIREALASFKKEVVPYGGEVKFGEEGGSLNQCRSESTVAQWQYGKLLIVYPSKYGEAKPILPVSR